MTPRSLMTVLGNCISLIALCVALSCSFVEADGMLSITSSLNLQDISFGRSSGAYDRAAQDQIIQRQGIKRDPYSGPYVDGDDDINHDDVRDRNQTLRIILIILGVILGLSSVLVLIIFCFCLASARRVQKLKLEQHQEELDRFEDHF